MKIVTKRNFGISTEYNSQLTQPWLLIAWDTANGLDVYEQFAEKADFLTRVEEVKQLFSTECEGLTA